MKRKTRSSPSRKKAAGKSPARSSAAKKPATRKAATRKAGAAKTARKKPSKPTTRKPAARKKVAKKAGKKKTLRKKPVAAPAPRKRPVPVLSLDHVLAWRMQRQQLDQLQLRPPANLAVTLARTGWLNSPSGSTPYLALAARFAAFTRHDLDQAVFQESSLVELPSVRGTTMVVPAEDAGLALQAYRPRHEARLVELLRKRRLMTRIEMRNLEDVIRAVLAGRSLSAEELRSKVPTRLVRDFGEAGQKQGVGTTVDLALWDLLSRGDVISRQAEQRLDRSGYRYVLRRDLLGPAVTADMRERPREEFLAALAERYFSWAGPARIADFAWWAGLPHADARTGVKKVRSAGSEGLARLKIEELGGEWFLPEEDLDAIVAFKPPQTPGVALVPFRDMLTGSWKTFDGLLQGADLKRSLIGWSGKPVPAKEAGPSGAHHHFVVIGGRIAGAWEHGTDGSLSYATFDKLVPKMEPLLSRRAAAMAEFIRRELGETRYYAGSLGKSSTLEAAATSWTRPTSRIAPRS